MIFILSLSFFTLPVSADTEIIQPSTIDTYMYQSNPTTNYGSENKFQVNQNIGYRQRSLVKFDLSSIPPGVQITSATLKLYLQYTSAQGRTYCVYRLTQSWTETGANWLRYDGTNPWSSYGGDYTEVGGACSTVPSVNNWMSWVVTDIVKAWIEGSEPNHGFLIKDSAEGPDEQNYMSQFSSREKPIVTENLRPILEITYGRAVGGELLPNTVSTIAQWLIAGISTITLGLALKKRKII